MAGIPLEGVAIHEHFSPGTELKRNDFTEMETTTFARSASQGAVATASFPDKQ
jgi:hypothetical protein